MRAISDDTREVVRFVARKYVLYYYGLWTAFHYVLLRMDGASIKEALKTLTGEDDEKIVELHDRWSENLEEYLEDEVGDFWDFGKEDLSDDEEPWKADYRREWVDDSDEEEPYWAHDFQLRLAGDRDEADY